MFVLNPDPYSLPCYRIGPFQTRDLSINHCLPDSDEIDDYFSARFADKEIHYTENGRKAIHLALSSYNLEKNDVVTILTTTNNFYISSCVTKEIEKFCKWSRKIVAETKIIFINHEFGYPIPDLHKLKEHKLPIIEDCAGSFFSEDDNKDIGETGDFVIYSFPKMFPIQVGGLLVSNLPDRLQHKEHINPDLLRYIKNVLSQYIGSKEAIIQKRFFNYSFLIRHFIELGFTERFPSKPGSVPGVFMFRTDNHKIDLPGLKKYFYAHGVQCSVFYGEEAFFIPVHQALNEDDLSYFIEVIRSYMEQGNLSID
jgi:hypothetical protein